MYQLNLIEAVLENMRQAQTQVDGLQASLTWEIKKISDTQGLDADFREKKIKEVRAKATPEIYERLGVINSKNEQLKKQATPFWQDRKFVLSKALLTPARKDDPTLPVEPDKESIARLSKLTEFSKMDDAHLRMTAENLIQEERHGELYLINLENDSRKGKAGWQPINLDGVKIPQRDTALKLLNEAQRMASTIHMQMQTAEGRKISPAEKITVARAGI